MRHPITWLGIFISIGAVVYFSWELDPQELVRHLVQANPGWLLLSVVLFCCSVLLRGPRWQRLARDVTTASTGVVTASLLVGFLANRVLFARIGEVIRCMVLARRSQASTTGLLATVAVEKVVDLLAVAICTTLAVAWWAALDSTGQESALAQQLLANRNVLLMIGLGGFVVLTLLAWWPARMQALIVIVTGWLPENIGLQIARIGHAVLDGLSALRSGKDQALIYLYTAGVWGLLFVSELCAIYAFDPSVPPVAALVLTVAIAWGVSVPQAPSYIGFFWVVVEKTLVHGFGMEGQLAKALALSLWVVQMLPIMLIGVGCLWSLEASLLDLGRRSAKGEPAEV